MITVEDIKLLVASGEGYNAEFKVSVPTKVIELSEEVCAFANAAGGVLLIGVNDQNQITGVNIDNAKRSAIQNSIGEITPALQCTLSIVEVDGKQIGIFEVPSGTNKPYGGNLYAQFRLAIEWLRSKLNVAYDIEGQGSGPRKEMWEIPETVFKEAIVNALAHRDYYDKGAKTLVELFDDRVEISNPGGLVSAIPLADFGKKSHSRNPLIFGLLARMHLVEQVGSGINRMNDLMKAAGLSNPIYNTDGMFTVIFSRLRKTTGKSSGKSSEKILRLMADNPTITIPEMAKSIKKSTRAVEKQISVLKMNKKLRRNGSLRSGSWEVLSKE